MYHVARVDIVFVGCHPLLLLQLSIRHEEAAVCAETAVGHAQREINDFDISMPSLAGGGVVEGGGRGRTLPRPGRGELYAALSAAYHNLAVELEFTGNRRCLSVYRLAIDTIRKHCGGVVVGGGIKGQRGTNGGPKGKRNSGGIGQPPDLLAQLTHSYAEARKVW